MDQNDILEVLRRVQHPETGTDLVSQGMIENLIVTGDKIQFTLAFSRSRDPFAASLKKACETILSETFPQYAGHISVFIKEAPPKKIEPKKPEPGSWTGGIKHIIAVSSAKGGVGKSTVTANLAVALQRMGYRVGILDADIYGPSMPTMFGVEGYQPAGDEEEEGTPRIYPALSMGVKVMSIGFFINPKDALIWRGPMATNALRQLTHQTDWGELDFLLIDMPPPLADAGPENFRGDHRQHAAKDRTGRRPARHRDVPGQADQYSRIGHCGKHGLVHTGRTACKPVLHLR